MGLYTGHPPSWYTNHNGMLPKPTSKSLIASETTNWFVMFRSSLQRQNAVHTRMLPNTVTAISNASTETDQIVTESKKPTFPALMVPFREPFLEFIVSCDATSPLINYLSSRPDQICHNAVLKMKSQFWLKSFTAYHVVTSVRCFDPSTFPVSL